MSLSEEEKILLKQYQELSGSLPSLTNRIAIEVVPAIIFTAAAIYTGKIIWFIVLIILMVFYNVQRVVRQHKNIKKLKSISEKTIGNISENKKPNK